MVLMLLVACAPAWGTWMFTKEVTLATGDECTDSISHNFVGAYEPVEVGDDPSWTELDTGAQSSEVFFGRLEEAGEGAVLIVGTEALPGTMQKDGSWLFYWTNSASGAEGLDHTTGYAWDYSYESSTKLLVQGTISGESFTGTWESETADVSSWTESDTWSEEAAVEVGGTGEIPSATYLYRVDTGTGAEETAENTQEEYDCGEAGCTLTVSEACAYRYTLTGSYTGFEPADSRWVEDAGQAAGN